MSKPKLRQMGEVTGDLEKLLFEMSGNQKHEHGLQKGEVLALVSRWFDIHNPEAIEKYVHRFQVDVDQPEEHYGFPRGKK